MSQQLPPPPLSQFGEMPTLVEKDRFGQLNFRDDCRAFQQHKNLNPFTSTPGEGFMPNYGSSFQRTPQDNASTDLYRQYLGYSVPQKNPFESIVQSQPLVSAAGILGSSISGEHQMSADFEISDCSGYMHLKEERTCNIPKSVFAGELNFSARSCTNVSYKGETNGMKPDQNWSDYMSQIPSSSSKTSELSKTPTIPEAGLFTPSVKK